MPVGIELADERAVLARLVVDLLGSVRANFFGEMDFISAIEVTIIGNCVFLAQYDGHPCTVTDLSRITGLSRASVRRRIERLIALRYLERRSSGYVIGPALAKSPNEDYRMLKQRIAMVHAASRDLAKMASRTSA